MSVPQFVPPWGWLQTMLGLTWPKGDEDALRRCGDAWAEAAVSLLDAAGYGTEVASKVNSVVDSPSADRFNEFWKKYVTGDGVLEQLAHQCAAMANYADSSATQIEETKISMNVVAVIMYIQFLEALAEVAASFGLDTPLVAAQVAIERWAAQSMLRMLIRSLIEALMFTLLPDLISESVTMAQGHRQPGEYDSSLLLHDLEHGIVLGGLFALPGIGGALGRKFDWSMPGFARPLLDNGIAKNPFVRRGAGVSFGGFSMVAGNAASYYADHLIQAAGVKDWAKGETGPFAHWQNALMQGMFFGGIHTAKDYANERIQTPRLSVDTAGGDNLLIHRFGGAVDPSGGADRLFVYRNTADPTHEPEYLGRGTLSGDGRINVTGKDGTQSTYQAQQIHSLDRHGRPTGNTVDYSGGNGAPTSLVVHGSDESVVPQNWSVQVDPNGGAQRLAVRGDATGAAEDPYSPTIAPNSAHIYDLTGQEAPRVVVAGDGNVVPEGFGRALGPNEAAVYGADGKLHEVYSYPGEDAKSVPAEQVPQAGQQTVYNADGSFRGIQPLDGLMRPDPVTSADAATIARIHERAANGTAVEDPFAAAQSEPKWNSADNSPAVPGARTSESMAAEEHLDLIVQQRAVASSDGVKTFSDQLQGADLRGGDKTITAEDLTAERERILIGAGAGLATAGVIGGQARDVLVRPRGGSDSGGGGRDSGGRGDGGRSPNGVGLGDGTERPHPDHIGDTSQGHETTSSGQGHPIHPDLNPATHPQPADHFDIRSQVEWTRRVYDTVRENPHDIETTAHNLADAPRADGGTGFTREELQAIRDHLFVAEHTLSDGRGGTVRTRFDEDPEIAAAWQRLSVGDARPEDLLLLDHEAAELRFREQSPDASHAEAHRAANDVANWEETLIPGERRALYDYTRETRENRGDPGVLREGGRGSADGPLPLGRGPGGDEPGAGHGEGDLQDPARRNGSDHPGDGGGAEDLHAEGEHRDLAGPGHDSELSQPGERPFPDTRPFGSGGAHDHRNDDQQNSGHHHTDPNAGTGTHPGDHPVAPLDAVLSDAQFRRTVTDAARNRAQERGTTVVAELQQFALLRALARVFAQREDNPWLLKGGEVILTRFPDGRATTDLDLVRIREGDRDAMAADYEAALRRDLGDHLRFELVSRKNLRDNPVVVQLQHRVMLAGREVMRLSVDLVNPGDGHAEYEVVDFPPQLVATGHPDDNPPLHVLPLTEVLVQKISAMHTRAGAHGEGPPERAQDLPDILVLALNHSWDGNTVWTALHGSEGVKGDFAMRLERGDPLDVPPQFELPNPTWGPKFAKYAADTPGLPFMNIGEAQPLARAFLDPLLRREGPPDANWDHSALRWVPRSESEAPRPAAGESGRPANRPANLGEDGVVVTTRPDSGADYPTVDPSALRLIEATGQGSPSTVFADDPSIDHWNTLSAPADTPGSLASRVTDLTGSADSLRQAVQRIRQELLPSGADAPTPVDSLDSKVLRFYGHQSGELYVHSGALLVDPGTTIEIGYHLDQTFEAFRREAEVTQTRYSGEVPPGMTAEEAAAVAMWRGANKLPVTGVDPAELQRDLVDMHVKPLRDALGLRQRLIDDYGIDPHRVRIAYGGLPAEDARYGESRWQRAHMIVLDALRRDPEGVRRTMIDVMSGPPGEAAVREQRVAAVVRNIDQAAGEGHDGKFVMLWVRDSRNAPAANRNGLDTQPGVLRQLIETARDVYPDRKIMLVGDDLFARRSELLRTWRDTGVLDGVDTATMVKYWDAARNDGRALSPAEQALVFNKLIHERDIIQIGTESGAMEIPFLLGARTVYLENQVYHLNKGNRWAQIWQDWQYGRFELARDAHGNVLFDDGRQPMRIFHPSDEPLPAPLPTTRRVQFGPDLPNPKTRQGPIVMDFPSERTALTADRIWRLVDSGGLDRWSTRLGHDIPTGTDAPRVWTEEDWGTSHYYVEQLHRWALTDATTAEEAGRKWDGIRLALNGVLDPAFTADPMLGNTTMVPSYAPFHVSQPIPDDMVRRIADAYAQPGEARGAAVTTVLRDLLGGDVFRERAVADQQTFVLGHVGVQDLRAALSRVVAEDLPSTRLTTAAIGKDIDTDLVNRLGNPDYRLVPADPADRTAGGRMVHVRDLAAQGVDERSGHVLPADSPRAADLVRKITTRRFGRTLSRMPNDSARARAIEEIVRERFDSAAARAESHDAELSKNEKIELEYNGRVLGALLEEQYERTQAHLTHEGVSELTLYAAVPDSRTDSPLGRWTSDVEAARAELLAAGESGTVVEARVPAARILAGGQTGPDDLPTGRYLVLGSHDQGMQHSVVGRVDRPVGDGVGDDRTGTGPESAGPAPTSAEEPVWAHVERTIPPPSDPGPMPHDPRNDLAGHPDWGRIDELLHAGREGDYPDWWPRDDSGYAIQQRDLDFLGISRQQFEWYLRREAPLGMTPDQFVQWRGELLEALRLDGVDHSEVDIRLKGSGARFFSGLHKELDSVSELADNPEALAQLEHWFGGDPDRPLRRPFDARHLLGLEPDRSDYDLDFSSTRMVDIARAEWPDSLDPDAFAMGHGFLDARAVEHSFPHVLVWRVRWREALGREMSVGVFESSGSFDRSGFGPISEHFRDDEDWRVHTPEP